jgi:hypothetical protein
MKAVTEGALLAVALAAARMLFMLVGCKTAAHLAADPPKFGKYSWLGFITQAGLSIALALQIEPAFPHWGEKLASLLIATVAINQLLGPVMFKLALTRAGETRPRLAWKKLATTKENRR